MSDKYLLSINGLTILVYKWDSKSNPNFSITLISGGNYDYKDSTHNIIYIYIQDTSEGNFLNEPIRTLLVNILKSFEELGANYIKPLTKSEILVSFIDNPNVYEALHAKNVIINSIREIYDINNIRISNAINNSIETIFYEHIYRLTLESNTSQNHYRSKHSRSSKINLKKIIIPAVIAISIIYFVIDPTIINNLLSDNSITQQNNNTNLIQSKPSIEDNYDTTTDKSTTDSTSNTSNQDNSNRVYTITVDVPKTYTHEELVQYALELINADRAKHNLPPVTLGKNIAAQKHADDMLKYKYISHLDSDGFKPYMRYTQYNGKGEVSENVAITGYYDNKGNTDCYKSHVLCEKIDPMEAIKRLQYDMVYNDADSNWGHRDNILDKWHNKVNIGIAYDDYFFVIVQHFENDYIDWDIREIKNGRMIISGRISTSIGNNTELVAVVIYYDPLPQKRQSAFLLNSTPDCYTYGGGLTCNSIEITTIYPPPPAGYIYNSPTHVANVWFVNKERFYIDYSLFVKDEGIYTYVLFSKIKEDYVPLMSYSIAYKDGKILNIGSLE